LPTPIKPISMDSSSSGKRFLQTDTIVSVSLIRVKARQGVKNLYAEGAQPPAAPARRTPDGFRQCTCVGTVAE
jgi:hypothetical protein